MLQRERVNAYATFRATQVLTLPVRDTNHTPRPVSMVVRDAMDEEPRAGGDRYIVAVELKLRQRECVAREHRVCLHQGEWVNIAREDEGHPSTGAVTHAADVKRAH